MSITAHLKGSWIGQIWLKYDNKIVLAVGIILIAAICFEAGYLHGTESRRESVIVEKAPSVACAPCPKEGSSSAEDANNSPGAAAANGNQLAADNQKCAFIASKNSNKYHLATCQWALKIKPENRICFGSVDEAQKRGYQGAKCCIK